VMTSESQGRKGMKTPHKTHNYSFEVTTSRKGKEKEGSVHDPRETERRAQTGWRQTTAAPLESGGALSWRSRGRPRLNVWGFLPGPLFSGKGKMQTKTVGLLREGARVAFLSWWRATLGYCEG